jgi:hypothetical protein
MNNSTSTTIKLPRQIEQKLLERVISDGYGMRGKSKWITEAVISFLQKPNYPEMVEIADEIDQMTQSVSMRFSIETTKVIDRAIIEVRKLYPALEGVKSNIIRASIMQRLLKK